MTVSSISPVNNYAGNGSCVNFDFDFLIESQEELVVCHTDSRCNQTVLEFGIDYSIDAIGSENGSFIVFPLETSSYGVLAKDEIITLSLNLPIEQESEFENSANLNLKILEKTFDYVVRILQILNRRIDRCVKVQEGSESNPENIIPDIEKISQAATIQADLSRGYANDSLDYAMLSKEYSKEAKFGLKWQSFTSDNWIENNDKYEIIFPNVGMIVGIYKGTIDNKQKIQNIDVVSLSDGVKIVSIEPFDGFILHSASIIGDYNHEQTLEADEWIINHNLGKKPIVTLVDENDIVMVGTIQYMSLNQIKVNFSAPVKGRAYLV